MSNEFNDMLSQSDGFYNMDKRTDRAVIIALVNKIEELEHRIDKMETDRLIEHFDQIEKERINKGND